MITLRGGINKTKQRLVQTGHQLPQTQQHVRSTKSASMAKEISQSVTDSAAVASYLYAEGIRQIIVAEKKEGAMEVWHASPSILPEIYALLAPHKVEVGDGIFLFNPAFYASLKGDEKRILIEHELWHLYLNRAFPRYKNEIKALYLNMSFRHPFLINNFLKRFEHYFLRSAAIQAGRFQFAMEDSELELEKALFKISELKDNPLEAAGACTGLILAHVLPFKTYISFAEKYLKKIREKIVGISDENVFKNSFSLATDIMNICLEDNREVRMEDLETPVSCLWLVFIEDYFPSFKK